MGQPSNQNEKTHLTIEPMTQNMQKFIKMKFELKNTKNWKHGMEWTKHGAMSYLKLMSIRLDVLNCIIFIYLCLFGKTI